MPVILKQPANGSVHVDNGFRLSVSASGRAAVTYQWYFHGTAISGATSSVFTDVATSSSAGVYTVVVSNIMGSVTSKGATLNVDTTPQLSAWAGLDGGGMGGGAPSEWFYGILLLVAAGRLFQRRRKVGMPAANSLI